MFNLGMEIVSNPYYIEGDDIKITFPLDPQRAESVARAAQGRVLTPPEGHLARRAADDSLVVVDAAQYGFAGHPYPTESTADWVVTEPQPRAFSEIDLEPLNEALRRAEALRLKIGDEADIEDDDYY
jgi:hypothetical protein